MNVETNAATERASGTDAEGIVRSDGAETPYRLRKLDSHNWIIERRTKKGRWKADGYYPRLEMAAQALLDSVLLSGDSGRTARDLLEAIKDARKVVTEAVRKAADKQTL